MFIVFAVGGICDFIYIFKMLFYFPGTRVNNYLLIVLKSGTAERQLNFVWQKIKWYGQSFAVGIIAITDCLESHEIIGCNKFVNDKNIILCTAATLCECGQIQGELSDGKR